MHSSSRVQLRAAHLMTRRIGPRDARRINYGSAWRRRQSQCRGPWLPHVAASPAAAGTTGTARCVAGVVVYKSRGRRSSELPAWSPPVSGVRLTSPGSLCSSSHGCRERRWFQVKIQARARRPCGQRTCKPPRGCRRKYDGNMSAARSLYDGPSAIARAGAQEVCAGWGQSCRGAAYRSHGQEKQARVNGRIAPA